MSEIESCIERIKNQKGVSRLIVHKRDSALETLRPLGEDPEGQEKQDLIKASMTQIVKDGESLVRDISPKDALRYVRIKTAQEEFMVAVDKDFIATVQQEWEWPSN